MAKRGPINPITVWKKPMRRGGPGGAWEAQVYCDFYDLQYIEKAIREQAGGPIFSREQGDVIEIFVIHDTKTAAEGTIRRWQKAIDEILESYHSNPYKKVFIGTCVDPPFDLETQDEIIENAKEITKRTFFKYCEVDGETRRLMNDFPSDFEYYKYGDIYFFTWSAIEHFFR